MGWQLLHGVVDILVGIVGGLVGAAVCSATVIWDTKAKRTAICFSSGECMTLGCIWHAT